MSVQAAPIREQSNRPNHPDENRPVTLQFCYQKLSYVSACSPVMTDQIVIADEPLEAEQIVHIADYVDSDTQLHRYACEIEDVHPGDDLNEYSYTVRSVVQERTLSGRYDHQNLIPSPRGYQNIDALLGEQPVKGEKLLGKFKRPDLELINTCLSVVDPKKDPTKDWLNELKKQDIDRINSVTAELILLYHLRTTYGHDQVSLNAHIAGENSKDFDIRVSTEEEDVWVEIVKPDYAASIPESVGFVSGETTGNSIDRKLRQKFETARDELSADTVLVLATYLEEQVTQGLQIGQWLEEDYYDVGEFCDAWLTYTHLTETEIQYQTFTEDGERCRAVFEKVVDN